MEELKIDDSVSQSQEKVEEEGVWQEIKEGDLCNMFGDYILYSDEVFGEKFNKEDFDYHIFNEDYYRQKFPGFNEDIYEILAQVSKEKLIDLRKRKELFKIEKKEVTINFNDE